jgi:hypothetical protein
MGVWYYIVNYTRQEYIFLGSGEPFFGPALQSATQHRNWHLTDNISVIPDSYFGDTIGRCQSLFTALYHRPNKDGHFDVTLPKPPLESEGEESE